MLLLFEIGKRRQLNHWWYLIQKWNQLVLCPSFLLMKYLPSIKCMENQQAFTLILLKYKWKLFISIPSNTCRTSWPGLGGCSIRWTRTNTIIYISQLVPTLCSHKLLFYTSYTPTPLMPHLSIQCEALQKIISLPTWFTYNLAFNRICKITVS